MTISPSGGNITNLFSPTYDCENKQNGSADCGSLICVFGKILKSILSKYILIVKGLSSNLSDVLLPLTAWCSDYIQLFFSGPKIICNNNKPNE